MDIRGKGKGTAMTGLCFDHEIFIDRQRVYEACEAAVGTGCWSTLGRVDGLGFGTCSESALPFAAGSWAVTTVSSADAVAV